MGVDQVMDDLPKVTQYVRGAAGTGSHIFRGTFQGA